MRTSHEYPGGPQAEPPPKRNCSGQTGYSTGHLPAALPLPIHMHKGCKGSRDAQGIIAPAIPDSQVNGKPVALWRKRLLLRVNWAPHPVLTQGSPVREFAALGLDSGSVAGAEGGLVQRVARPPRLPAPCSALLRPVNGQGRGLLPLAVREVGEFNGPSRGGPPTRWKGGQWPTTSRRHTRFAGLAPCSGQP